MVANESLVRADQEMPTRRVEIRGDRFIVGGPLRRLLAFVHPHLPLLADCDERRRLALRKRGGEHASIGEHVARRLAGDRVESVQGAAAADCQQRYPGWCEQPGLIDIRFAAGPESLVV